MITDFIYLAIFPKANIKSKQMMSQTTLIFFTEKLHPKSLFYLACYTNFLIAWKTFSISNVK